MNNSAAKVGEIFTEAGAAFNRLAEMTMLLHPLAEQTSGTSIKTPVKRKAPDEKPVISTNAVTPPQQVQTNFVSQQVTVTAPEAEIEVETTSSDVKMEIEPVTEEVVTTQ